MIDSPKYTPLESMIRTARRRWASAFAACMLAITIGPLRLPAQDLPKVDKVELQPLRAEISRVIEALDYLGAPISPVDKQNLVSARSEADGAKALAEIRAVTVDVAISAARQVIVTELDEARGGALIDAAIVALPQQLQR